MWKRLILARRRLSIVTKFALAFVALLLLIGIVALTGFVSLNDVQHKTQAVIFTSFEVQHRVFEMDGALRRARRIERDFFLNWPTGLSSRELENYRERHLREIDKVVELGSNLQVRLAGTQMSATLRQQNLDVLDYVEIVTEYSRRFNEAVGLVSDLGIVDVGKLAQLEQNSDLLRDRLLLIESPDLLGLYRQMASFEEQYLATRETKKKTAMYKAAQRLRDRLVLNSKLDAITRAEILGYLDAYRSDADDIVRLFEEIPDTIRHFDQQTEGVSHKLIELVSTEVEHTRRSIDRTSITATILLVVAVLVAFLLAGAVAQLFISALSTVALEQAQAERLLLNILPGPIAEQLKREERTIAESFPEVTIMFADIVGFTELAARTPPIELVEILNVIFSEFDQLTEEHGLEKIKTIGDAYMVVGGCL